MHTTGWRLGCGSSRRTSLAFFSAAGVFTPDVGICVAYTHPQGKVAQQAPRCYDLEERTPIRHPAIWSGHGMGGKVVTPLALRVPEVEEGHD